MTVIPDFPAMVWPAPAVHVPSAARALMVVMPEPRNAFVAASMIVLVTRHWTFVMAEQSRNALLPIVVTLEPMVRLPVKPEQELNALLPIEVTEFGIVRLPVKLEQDLNALSPIEVTEFGMVRLPVKPEQE